MSVELALRHTIESVCSNTANYATERDFQVALAAALGGADRELLMTFDHPPIPAQRPSAEDVAFCAERNKTLVPEGKDPCDGRSRKLDILWNDVPIELKSATKVKADVCGYLFLKDIHRLERLSSVAIGAAVADTRFAVYVSSDPDLWSRKWSNAPDIRDGRVLEPGHWVQYEQQSPRTRWFDYPPFYLAGRYKLEWMPLSNGAKYLLVPVRKQVRKDKWTVVR